ncbi:hypothetical protein HY968_02770 [Candidatus Kaiserbacteria bacterium]|nr:hypothetical protein [Candidatus Kaiserbacteria bacterium]
MADEFENAGGKKAGEHPVPVLREERTLGNVAAGIEPVLAGAGLTPAFPRLVENLNRSLAHARIQSAPVIKTVEFTLWPDEENPIIERKIEARGRFIAKFQVIPGQFPGEGKVQLTVSTRPDLDFERRAGSFEGRLWRLDQLQTYIQQAFPGKKATLHTVQLSDPALKGLKNVKQKPFEGDFLSITQAQLEKYQDPTLMADGEVYVEGIKLPVLYLGLDSPPRQGMKMYCNAIHFYFEGKGAEAERVMVLLNDLFQNLPDPFKEHPNAR